MHDDKYAQLFLDYSRLKGGREKIELACSRKRATDNSTKIALVFERPVFNETRRFNFRGVW